MRNAAALVGRTTGRRFQCRFLRFPGIRDDHVRPSHELGAPLQHRNQRVVAFA